MREPCLDYFYGDEARVDSFCRLPRIFITHEFYRTIPIEIKILYSVMLDRVAMSMRNNWRENGRVFIYFTLKEAMRTVHVGKHKAVSLFARMETLGLIRRRKQERGKPDRILCTRVSRSQERGGGVPGRRGGPLRNGSGVR